MKSITATTPSAVSNSVSRTSVSSWYFRRTAVTLPCGATSQRPWSGVPSRAEKHAPESNRGMHIQSIDPSMPTSAAVWQSPMRA